MFEYIVLGVAIAINIVGISYSIFRNTNLFKCRHHEFIVYERSNAIQQDSMGYPLRLCIFRCARCGKTEQQWIDVNVLELEELKNGNSFLIEWDKIKPQEGVGEE